MGNIARIPSVRLASAALPTASLHMVGFTRKASSTPVEPDNWPAGTPEAIKQSCMLWYDPVRQGCTNENMEANPVLKDLTGNGHDATCYNFAWKAESGIGGYKIDFSTWTQSTRCNIETTPTTITITNINSPGEMVYAKPDKLIWPSIRVRVTGLDEPPGLPLLSYVSYGANICRTIVTDGIYTLPGVNADILNALQFNLQNGIPEKIVIEQLPDYPGALVSDGVTDFAQAVGLPLLTKGKGYTIIAKRVNLNKPSSSENYTVASKSKALDNGAFISPLSRSACYNFGKSAPIQLGTAQTVWQTSKQFCGQDIEAGDGTDTDTLTIASTWEGDSRFNQIVLYSLLLFDRDLTEEEIEWVKTNITGEDVPAPSYDNIGILLKDGTNIPYSQTADSYAKEDVEGITYTDSDCSFCMSLDELEAAAFGASGDLATLPDGMTSLTFRQSISDFDGQGNTEKLAQVLTSHDYAVWKCKDYMFPSGQGGYLGAIGEYHKVTENFDVINELIAKCGGTVLTNRINEYYLWSSSPTNVIGGERYTFMWAGNGLLSTKSITGTAKCRPLRAYTPTAAQNTGE